MLVYYILALLSLLFFLGDFFPFKENKPSSLTRAPSSLENVAFDTNKTYKPVVDKLVFIVIDALRTDFINAENMPFLTSQIEPSGCLLQTIVESPTVTLPRIKALTTGNVPQFVDVILNLATSEVLQDSFLHKAVEAGKRLVFYGDNTWLKLYPNLFVRSEGTSSFYVNDFSEVDDNVTQPMRKELQADDWDVMILHYLGLDHIGHVYGPYSKLINPKLQEMDQVIKVIHTELQRHDKKTLVLVTGDHGMKDSGGHGGASHAETHVPLALLGVECADNKTIKQTDIPTTLSILFGLNIPATSVGRFVTGLLPIFSLEQQLYVLMYNSLILKGQTAEHEGTFSGAFEAHTRYLFEKSDVFGAKARNLYLEYLENCSGELLKSSVEHDVFHAIVSLVLIGLCFVNILCVCVKSDQSTSVIFVDYDQLLMFLVMVCLYVKVQTKIITICFVSIVVLCVAAKLCTQLRRSVFENESLKPLLFFVSGCVLHVLTFISSSFIEEEHQFWYFTTSTFLMYVIVSNVKKKLDAFTYLMLFCGLRFVRKLNQTGDKFSHLPDLADWFLIEENLRYLQIFHAFGLIMMYLCCFTFCKRSKSIIFLNAITLTLIFIFKNAFAHSIAFGQLIWLTLILNAMVCFALKVSFVNIWCLTCSLLLRPYNVVLLPAAVVSSIILNKHFKQVEILTFFHLCLGNTLYFCQGHSNSLASVDVASGYVGLRHYHPFIVIGQVLMHTYALPVLTLALITSRSGVNVSKIWTLCAITYVLRIMVMCILALVFKHHLFIWTVFSPKVLIESSHFLILGTQIILYYCYVNVQMFLNKTLVYYK